MLRRTRRIVIAPMSHAQEKGFVVNVFHITGATENFLPAFFLPMLKRHTIGPSNSLLSVINNLCQFNEEIFKISHFMVASCHLVLANFLSFQYSISWDSMGDMGFNLKERSPYYRICHSYRTSF